MASQRDHHRPGSPSALSLGPAAIVTGAVISAVQFQQVAALAPGASLVEYAPGQNKTQIRGLSASAGDPLVGYHLDETPRAMVMGLQIPDTSVFDLDRLEVLRGPQGTLYGDNAMGGVVPRTRRVGRQRRSRPRHQRRGTRHLPAEGPVEARSGFKITGTAWISRADSGAPNGTLGDPTTNVHFPQPFTHKYDIDSMVAEYDTPKLRVGVENLTNNWQPTMPPEFANSPWWTRLPPRSAGIDFRVHH